jgi:hypothetical protein
LATNDPAHPVITFTLVADIKRLPDVYRRFQNADFVNGQRVATFEVWPSAHPFIVMEKGERLTVPLRVSRGQLDTGIASVTTEDAGRKYVSGAVRPGQVNEEQSKPPFPPGAVAYRIRPGASQRGFWIDIEIAGVVKGGQYRWSANIADPSGGESIPIELSALVFEENLIVNPQSLDAREVSLAALKDTPIIVARMNVRKMIGSIHIKAVTSTLTWVKGGLQVLVDGSNYLVRVYLLQSPGVAPGQYEGTIRIGTDDPARPQIDVPFKVTLIP